MKHLDFVRRAGLKALGRAGTVVSGFRLGVPHSESGDLGPRDETTHVAVKLDATRCKHGPERRLSGVQRDQAQRGQTNDASYDEHRRT